MLESGANRHGSLAGGRVCRRYVLWLEVDTQSGPWCAVGWRLHFVVMHHDCVTDRLPDVCELNRGWSTAVVTGLHDTLICHPESA